MSAHDTDSRGLLDETVLASLREILGGAGGRGLANLFSVYRRSATELMQELRSAVESGDARAVDRSAHALKSSSRNVGAMSLGALFEQLETLGRDGELVPAKDLLARASAEFERVLEALAREA